MKNNTWQTSVTLQDQNHVTHAAIVLFSFPNNKYVTDIEICLIFNLLLKELTGVRLKDDIKNRKFTLIQITRNITASTLLLIELKKGIFVIFIFTTVPFVYTRQHKEKSNN